MTVKNEINFDVPTWKDNQDALVSEYTKKNTYYYSFCIK